MTVGVTLFSCVLSIRRSAHTRAGNHPCTRSCWHPRSWTPAATETDSNLISPPPPLSLTVPGLDAMLASRQRPAPATNRAARLVVAVVCVTRERLRLLRVTQASCLPVTNPGLASQLAPGQRGRAFCLVWFCVYFFFNAKEQRTAPT